MSGSNNLPPVQQYMGYHGNQDPQLVEPAQLPQTTTTSINSQQNLAQHQHQLLQAFWGSQLSEVENGQFDFRVHQLPLARIKKVMKTDEDVKMISAEAPIIFAKSCEIMILELTLRAWIHAEENKRRTLQRSDIAAAISKTDMFDFLIDIVPREDSSRNTTSAIKAEKVGENANPSV
ncbi:histone-fold-containing protein [Basidiobolus meristosporus CBS 931.73]|uniref:Histone-fold-containing protein n=1 Tax=Basidiobolus meristosporus CBS 931.73 TaxID=1314790 RepID=A0A1Y1XV43_9FUNG|nr:histone-fold-containing protein [Basidiobolus meristosporus CBS 931.73]|eukprot:ORX89144.1 histone-fold-containing protein [Basidiobolus meristosporus CBS 931.73]